MSVSLRNLIGRLNPVMRSSTESAAALCVSRAHADVGIEHLIRKLLDEPRSDFMLIASHFHLLMSGLAAGMERALDAMDAGKGRTPSLSAGLVDALTEAWVYGSIDYNARSIRSGFLAMALTAEGRLRERTLQISDEFRKVDHAALRHDFAAITALSIEAADEADEPAAKKSGPAVFISYRRDTSHLYATILQERLITAAPGLRVFRDRDSLLPGVVFADEIRENIRAADIVLALIDEHWFRVKNADGRRRIEDPADWVRLELSLALNSAAMVVPCLIGKATLPAAEQLPPDLAGLAARQAIRVSKEITRSETGPLVEIVRNWRDRRSYEGAATSASLPSR